MISSRKLIWTWSTFVLRALCWLYLNIFFESLNCTTDFWTHWILHQMGLCLMIHLFISFFSGYTLFWDFFFLAIFSVYMSFLWSCWDPSFPKPGQHGMEELLQNYVPTVCRFRLFLAHRHPWEGLDSLFFGSFYVLHLTFFHIFYLLLCFPCVEVWYC